jgi:hypothetical protein
VPKPVRRRAARALLSSGLVSILVVAAYFLLPLSSNFTSTTLVLLVVGLVALSALLFWHLRSIMRSPYPRVRAIAALATTVPMFLVLFATAYFVMSRTVPASFSEPLSRLDSAYFTITVFSTVGFGDIVAQANSMRALVTVQMLLNLVLLGLVIRLLTASARRGIARQGGRTDLGEMGRAQD